MDETRAVVSERATVDAGGLGEGAAELVLGDG
jgi:hypothetical protein